MSVVDLYRSDPELADIQIGEPVRAQTWERTARLLQWVRGRCRLLIPTHRPAYTKTGGSTTVRYWVAPSGYAIARVWILDVRSSTKTAPSAFTVQAGAGAATGSIRVDGRSATAVPVVYVEPGATQSTTAAEISAVITATLGTIRVESVTCYELPRASLDPSGGTDYGLDLDSYYPRSDIFESATGGLFELAAALEETDTRRIGAAAWWSDLGVSTTSASYVDVYPTPIRMVPAQDLIADTTRLIQCGAYGFASNGTTTGDLRIKDTAGNVSAAISIPLLGTTPAWQGVTELAFLCEDLTKTDGVRTGGERVQVQIRRTAGAGTITWNGWTLYEKHV